MPKYGAPRDHVAKAHKERMLAEVARGLREPLPHRYKDPVFVYRAELLPEELPTRPCETEDFHAE